MKLHHSAVRRQVAALVSQTWNIYTSQFIYNATVWYLADEVNFQSTLIWQNMLNVSFSRFLLTLTFQHKDCVTFANGKYNSFHQVMGVLVLGCSGTAGC